MRSHPHVACFPACPFACLQDKATFLARVFKKNTVALSRAVVGRTLNVNQLTDMQWRFGVTSGSSETRTRWVGSRGGRGRICGSGGSGGSGGTGGGGGGSGGGGGCPPQPRAYAHPLSDP